MEITLPRDLEQTVNDCVEAGEYSSASEMVAHALQNLLAGDVEPDMTEDELRAAIDDGLAALARGDMTKVRSREDAAALFDGIKREGRARLAAQRNQTA